MTFTEILSDHRDEYLTSCLERLRDGLGITDPDSMLETTLPELLDEVCEVIGAIPHDESEDPMIAMTHRSSRLSAREAHERGYTISQLVGTYGAICQGITLQAHRTKAEVSARNFSQLNLWLDVSIAQAVTEYQQLEKAEATKSESDRLGILVHDLRNALAGAMLAHDLVKMGGLASRGPTNEVLTEALVRMKDLIDRSVAKVRIGNPDQFEQTEVRVLDILSDVESTLIPESAHRSVRVRVAASPKLKVFVDSHLMSSAVANLAQNAVKFTKLGGSVWIRAFAEDEEVVIEIQDECGGIPPGTMKTLFEPGVQVGEDRSGMGLGLGIARSAAEMNGGTITVKNDPGAGCTFTLRLPAVGATPTVGPKKSSAVAAH